MLQRAYSTIELKSVDEESRVITGIASTPTPDRVGDIVEPSGANFKTPLPLLWQHRADQPIGHVIEAKVTPAGIAITAQIAKGVLPRIDEAWALIKSGLVRGLSIGFRPTQDPEPIKGSWGVRFTKWEWLELSAVTIPANADASITAIKSIAEQESAALGAGPADVVRPSTRVRVSVNRASSGAHTHMKTYSEQIKDFEATRAAKVSERTAIQEKAATEGRTKDASEKETFDTLTNEIESIDAELKDLRVMERDAMASATVVKGNTPAEAAQSRSYPSIQVKQVLPPGFGFARAILCKMNAWMDHVNPVEIAKMRYPSDDRLHTYLKTSVGAGTTTDTNWATQLVDQTTLEQEFVEYLRPMTLIGKFGQNGIPSLRHLPFNVRIPSQTTAGAASWVGEGKAKPLTSFQFSQVTLPYTKLATIAVITKELARFSQPGAEAIVRDQLAKALIQKMDSDFIDPDISVSSGVRPASITNGVTALTSAGTSADNARTDVQNLVEQFILNNYQVDGLVLIMPQTLALALSSLHTTLAAPQFPGLSVNGGFLHGIPVITTQLAASGASYGNMVIAVNAHDVGIADDGRVDISVSGEASLEMSDAPSGDATNGTGASVVSMFQTNSLAILAERFVTWKKLRSTAVSYIDDVNWGSIGSPV